MRAYRTGIEGPFRSLSERLMDDDIPSPAKDASPNDRAMFYRNGYKQFRLLLRLNSVFVDNC